MSTKTCCPIQRSVYLFLTIVLLCCAALFYLPQLKVPSNVTKWIIRPVDNSNRSVADGLIKQPHTFLARSKALLQELDTVVVTPNVTREQLRGTLEQSPILQKKLDVFLTQSAVRLNQSVTAKDDQPNSEQEGGLLLQCNNVLGQMLKGHWRQRVMTAQEEVKMKQFHITVSQEQGIAPTLQRPDLKCGNISLGMFRALCDPDGPTPCCYSGSCTKKPQEECACPDCFDMRARIHAEFATWVPGNPSCKVHNFSLEQMCQLLDNSTVYFIGDSYIRHIYTAFLMFARNDGLGGALHAKTPPEVRKRCLGLYMFTEKTCRHHVDWAVTLCGGRVKARMFYLYSSALARNIHSTIDQLKHQTRSFVFLGTGLHDGFNTNSTQTHILLPVLQKRKALNLTWPKLVWATAHAPGLLKAPWKYPEQSFQGVSNYNSKMIQFLSPWNVPIFDTYNMTLLLRSFDGNHYGLGTNRMKVRILLNYLLELFTKKLW